MNPETGPSPNLEAQTFEPHSDDVPLQEWAALCEGAEEPNPFFSPGFLVPFLKNMHITGVRLVVVRDIATAKWLVAAPVGPRRPGFVFRIPTVWATEYGPLGTPLVHPSASEEALRLFAATASGKKRQLAIPYLPTNSKTAIRFQDISGWESETKLKSERASHDAGDKGAAQLEAAFSGKRRKEMKRLLRRLEDNGAVDFRHLIGKDVIAGFEEFLDLEVKGWKGKAKTALASQSETAAFARQAIVNACDRASVRIDQLWSGPSLVASLVLFLAGGHIYSWKIAFDERFAKFSPGTQIALAAMQENLRSPDFKQADSLAIPGHSMIEPLWRGRIETGTLLLTTGPFAELRQELLGADIDLHAAVRKKAKILLKRR